MSVINRDVASSARLYYVALCIFAFLFAQYLLQVFNLILIKQGVFAKSFNFLLGLDHFEDLVLFWMGTKSDVNNLIIIILVLEWL